MVIDSESVIACGFRRMIYANLQIRFDLDVLVLDDVSTGGISNLAMIVVNIVVRSA
jgi:hypothetical protein